MAAITINNISNFSETAQVNEAIKGNYGKKDLGYCRIVGGGYFGSSGDIVVDSILNPKRVFGIAAGDGTFKKEHSLEDKRKITQLEKEII